MSKLQNFIMWFVRFLFSLLPTLLFYSTIALTGKREGKNFLEWVLDLIGDGQLCLISFTLATSSIVNLLQKWLHNNSNTWELLILIILILFTIASIWLHFMLNGAYGGNKQTTNIDIKLRNWLIFIILGIVVLFSFITDVLVL